MTNGEPVSRVAHIMLDALHACDLEAEAPTTDGSVIVLALVELGQAAAVTFSWEETEQGTKPRVDFTNLIAGYLTATAELLQAVTDLTGLELDLSEVIARARERIDD